MKAIKPPVPTHRKILIASAAILALSAINAGIFSFFPCIVQDAKEKLFPENARCQDHRANHVGIVEREFIKWTPDGSRIIFDFDSHPAMDQSIWSINHDGTDLTKLADGKPYKWLPDKENRTGYGISHGFHADLSPDGKTLAYSVCDSNRKNLKFHDGHTQGSYDIAITRMDGEKPIVIALGEGQQGNVRWLPGRYQGYPSWSPDGTEIAFIQGEYGLGFRLHAKAVHSRDRPRWQTRQHAAERNRGTEVHRTSMGTQRTIHSLHQIRWSHIRDRHRSNANERLEYPQ